MKKKLTILFLCALFIHSAFGSSSDAKLSASANESKFDTSAQTDPFLSQLEDYRSRSWYQQQITLKGGRNYTIEQALLKAFYNPNGNFNAVGNRDILDKVKTNRSLTGDFIPPLMKESSFSDTASFNDWVDNMNLIEIDRFNQFLQRNPNYIDLNHPEKDDLVKAIILSGIIWCVKKEKTFFGETLEADPRFSAILVPGQPYGSQHYRIYTCFHGFNEKCSDSFTYYFVPYGMIASSDQNDTNFIENVGFKIEFIQHFISSYRLMKDISFRAADQRVSVGGDLNEDNDFIVAFLKPKSNVGVALPEFFEEQHRGKRIHSSPDQDHFPIFNDQNEVINPHSFNSYSDTLFIVGKAVDKIHAFPLDVTRTTSIATTVTPEELWDSSYLKEESVLPDQESFDFGSGLSTVSGMSGGGILHCRWKDDKRVCKIIGTLYGNRKLYNSRQKSIVTRINKIPQNLEVDS